MVAQLRKQLVGQAIDESIVRLVAGKRQNNEAHIAQRGPVDPPVSPAGDGFNEPRLLRIVAKRRPQALDGGVETVLEVDKGALRPQPARQLFASNDLARPIEQNAQDLKGLRG